MQKGPTNFGEWLKIRRLAAELTPLDLAKALQMDAGAYRELEAGRGGISERQIALLVKIEKMRVGRRDVEHARPPLVAEEGYEAPTDAGPAKPTSALDAILASVQAKNERVAQAANAPKTPLAGYLREKAQALTISRLELAKKCRLAPTDLDDIEAGFVPGPATLKAIAAGLGVDPAELLEVAGTR